MKHSDYEAHFATWKRTLPDADRDTLHAKTMAHIAWQRKHRWRSWRVRCLPTLWTGLILMMLLAVFARTAHCQFSRINSIATQNSGSNIGFHASPFRINCTGSLSCSDDGYTLTMSASSSGGGLPSGAIIFVASGSCPAGFTQASQAGDYLVMTTAVNGDAGTTGGSNSYTPSGSVTAPTFSGSLGTVPAQTISWPASVPLFAGSAGTVPAETFSGSSGTVPAETFTGSAATTSAVSAGTPAGTNGTAAVTTVGTKMTTSSSGTYAFTTLAGTAAAASPTVTVPAETFTGSALATHTHTLTATGTNGTASFTPSGTNSTASFTPSGTLTWPVSVPTNSSASFTPAGTNSAPTFSGSPATLTPTYWKLIPCSAN